MNQRNIALTIGICSCLTLSASADNFVEPFTGGSNTGGWKYGTGNERIEDPGGNPGAYLHDPLVDTFAPWPLTTSGQVSPFIGNYRTRAVTTVGVDLFTYSVETAGGRPLSVILHSDNNTPGNINDDWGAYFVGPTNIPFPGQGWISYQFVIPSQATSLPAGWEIILFGLNSPPNPDWNDVITDVNRLSFFYGDPSFLFIYQEWNVGMDNPSITSGATGFTPPGIGDDTCQTPTTDTGTPCSTDADCTPPAVCGLKSRYITIVPAVTFDIPITIQVEIVSMPLFSSRDGEIWWAGPGMSIPNSPNAPLVGASLLCETSPSNAQIWAEDYLHLFGPPIIPGSTYNVRICVANGANCSAPLPVATGKWGDIVQPFGGSGQPNFGDIPEIVDKFRNLPSAADMPRVDLVGPGNIGQPNTPNQVPNFADISADVDAFRGFAYPHTVPACP